jgi:hypothetical protein
MLKEELEKSISKGTRSQEGIKPSVNRYRLNEIVSSIHDVGALRLTPKVDVELEHLSPEHKDKMKTFLQTRENEPTEVNPFADTAFGIRKIHEGKGPLHIEVTGDKFDKVPWVLTVEILESAMGWNYRGAEEIVYVRTRKGVRRMKNAGLFYDDNESVAVMYRLKSYDDWNKILVEWLESERQILVEYKPAGRSDGGSRLGYRYFIDYVMFCSSWVKQKAIEILSAKGRDFSDKYELTLAQTKKKLMHLRDD